jgi:putative SOS response-associated peptidase YedK
MTNTTIEGEIMCGRIIIGFSIEELEAHVFDNYQINTKGLKIDLPRYNVSPGQNVISIINDGVTNRVGLLKWGFVPFFAKDEKVGFSMINARSESIHEKKAFKDSLKYKRCIILADGFYEWERKDTIKTPMRILFKDQKIFPIAGLWSSYTRADGTKLYTCTIITTKANDVVSPIHERMPVILNDISKDIWLNPSITDSDSLTSILVPYDASKMFKYKVSPLVNKSTNDSIDCIKPIESITI